MIIDLFSFCISEITLTSLSVVLFKYAVSSNPAVPHLSGTRTGFSMDVRGGWAGGEAGGGGARGGAQVSFTCSQPLTSCCGVGREGDGDRRGTQKSFMCSPVPNRPQMGPLLVWPGGWGPLTDCKLLYPNKTFH